jgi:hypothetical protein
MKSVALLLVIFCLFEERKAKINVRYESLLHGKSSMHAKSPAFASGLIFECMLDAIFGSHIFLMAESVPMARNPTRFAGMLKLVLWRLESVHERHGRYHAHLGHRRFHRTLNCGAATWPVAAFIGPCMAALLPVPLPLPKDPAWRRCYLAHCLFQRTLHGGAATWPIASSIGPCMAALLPGPLPLPKDPAWRRCYLAHCLFHRTLHGGAATRHLDHRQLLASWSLWVAVSAS